MTFSLLGYSQTTEQQAQVSQRKADAGKADVIITKNKSIYDNTTLKITLKPQNTRLLKKMTGRSIAPTEQNEAVNR